MISSRRERRIACCVPFEMARFHCAFLLPSASVFLWRPALIRVPCGRRCSRPSHSGAGRRSAAFFPRLSGDNWPPSVPSRRGGAALLHVYAGTCCRGGFRRRPLSASLPVITLDPRRPRSILARRPCFARTQYTVRCSGCLSLTALRKDEGCPRQRNSRAVCSVVGSSGMICPVSPG